MPENTISIGHFVFNFCTNLTHINFSKKLVFIGEAAFQGTAILSAKIPHGVKSIMEGTFANCTSLENVEFSEGVEVIEWQSFANCLKITSLKIPETTTFIGHEAFINCRCLTAFVIPQNVETIEYDVFKNCDSLSEIVIMKPENSISGSPWGAVNAEITWEN
ncbi:MAG: leucine-rich repeat domain-containing protein [Ruminococcus sp.]|nr:leucine-rich repeat domain-containing protein [Ruminococcus sp.]